MRLCENCSCKSFPRLEEDGYKSGMILTAEAKDWFIKAKAFADEGAPHPGKYPSVIYEKCKTCKGKGATRPSFSERIKLAISVLLGTQ